MADIIVSVVAMFLGAVALSLAVGIARFLRKKKEISKFVSSVDSGIYIEHGMVIDPKSGLVTPQQKPSRQAYSHFWL